MENTRDAARVTRLARRAGLVLLVVAAVALVGSAELAALDVDGWAVRVPYLAGVAAGVGGLVVRLWAAGVDAVRVAAVERARVRALVADLAGAVATLNAKADGDSNDEEIDAAHDLAGEVEAACAELESMVAA